MQCFVQAVAERNSAEGRAQRSAAAQMKVKADLAQLEIKLQVCSAPCPLQGPSLFSMDTDQLKQEQMLLTASLQSRPIHLLSVSSSTY